MSDWTVQEGEKLEFEKLASLYHTGHGGVREVRRLKVTGGWVYHFTTTMDKQRTESAVFVPGE